MITYLRLLETPQDKEVFATLYETCYRQLYNRAFSLMKDPASAEDLVHETFLTVARNMDRINKENVLQNWNYLQTILQNLCFNALKKQKKVICHNMEAVGTWTVSEEDMETDYIGKEMADTLKELIWQLKYPYRQVICLQYYNNMSSAEIAKTLQLTRENVRQISRRAREQLRVKLEKMGYDT